MQFVQIDGAKGLFELLAVMGTASLQGDIARAMRLAFHLGVHVENAWLSEQVMLPELAQGVYELLTFPGKDGPDASLPMPREYAALDAWLTVVEQCALALVGAKALEWKEMVQILEDHLGAWMKRIEEAQGGNLWMFSQRAVERRTFFGGNLSPWTESLPAINKGGPGAALIYQSDLQITVAVWLSGNLHPADTKQLRWMYSTGSQGIRIPSYGESMAALVDHYRTAVLAHLSDPTSAGSHKIIVQILPSWLSKHVAHTKDSLGSETRVALIPTPHIGDRYCFELHRCLHEEGFALTLVLLSGTEVRSNAPRIITQGHPSIERSILGLGDGEIVLEWQQPTPLEILRALRHTLEQLQPEHSLAGDERTGAICLAAMKYFSEWEVLQPVYALSPRYPSSCDPPPDAETVDAWRTAATLFVECYNLTQALIDVMSDEDEPDPVLERVTLNLLAGLMRLDIGGLCRAMGEVWAAEHVTGKPFGVLCSIALPAVGEKSR